MTRGQHLAWCKQRALGYVDAGQLDEAFASMVSDLGKHDDTVPLLAVARDLGGPLLLGGHLSTPRQMRGWIEGFN